MGSDSIRGDHHCHGIQRGSGGAPADYRNCAVTAVLPLLLPMVSTTVKGWLIGEIDPFALGREGENVVAERHHLNAQIHVVNDALKAEH
jgi:hypothetical protein